jgi:glycosyltransferase involved in cell wall biosynthesis
MIISIIVPCYNNAESIEELFSRILDLQNKTCFENHSFELVFVDDGSSDATFLKLTSCIASNKINSKIVKLTRNFGSYNAFLAGMNNAAGDCCVHLHADLQDPPELIENLFTEYLKGFKLVIANRTSREDASIFSSIYHILVKKYAISNTPPGGFDLILFDKVILNDILKISEKNTNNVYLINWLGYPYVSIPYNRVKRKHGKSQWSFSKKIRLFVDTFFSFSSLPIQTLRYSFYISLLILLAAILNIFFEFYAYSSHFLVLGFVLSFFSLNISILGEYLVRIHETVRNRPSFVVEKIIENQATVSK